MNVDDLHIFLPIKKVTIGFSTRSVLAKHNFLPREKCQVAKHCQLFMIDAYKYAICHLPIHDPVLLHVEVLQFDHRSTADFDSLVFFLWRNSLH